MSVEMNGKSVLVTGAGGFIGSHLAEALVHAGVSRQFDKQRPAPTIVWHAGFAENVVLRSQFIRRSYRTARRAGRRGWRVPAQGRSLAFVALLEATRASRRRVVP